MRLSTYFAPTLRENPTEAEVVSHQLLMRAGYIRRVAAGIYNYLPLMWRVMKKVEDIVRDEMDKAGAQELLMPILQPADLWQESGRWAVYGKELIRLKDRHNRDCVLGPTHEEVITTIAKEIHSYKQLPMNLYQIQNKYRDEIRPRFGLLRGREFIMKDAYSFHTSDEDLDKEYNVMAQAYKNIFKRCGMDTRMVRSDSGAIGGDVSHEFMVLTDTHSGECDVYYCDTCEYAANSNRAESILPEAVIDGSSLFASTAEVSTPGTDTIENLSEFLKAPPSLICKALLYIVDEKEPLLALVRGDLEVEEVKMQNASGGNEIRMATPEEIAELTGSRKGFVGVGASKVTVKDGEAYVEMKQPIRLVLDHSVKALKSFIVAANKPDFHTVGFNWDALGTIPESAYRDLKLARIGDGCPDCNGKLLMTRGIEVGNIFKLGTKYSEKMSATYTDETGTEKHFIMGCYGIGVSRTAASAIESSHDKDGIIWPLAIAPFHVVVVPVNVEDETVMGLAEQVYADLKKAGYEVVIDDRNERAGVKFKDADLMGFPIRITSGKKAAEGVLEVKLRDGSDMRDVPAAGVIDYVKAQFEKLNTETPLTHA